MRERTHCSPSSYPILDFQVGKETLTALERAIGRQQIVTYAGTKAALDGSRTYMGRVRRDGIAEANVRDHHLDQRNMFS